LVSLHAFPDEMKQKYLGYSLWEGAERVYRRLEKQMTHSRQANRCGIKGKTKFMGIQEHTHMFINIVNTFQIGYTLTDNSS